MTLDPLAILRSRISQNDVRAYESKLDQLRKAAATGNSLERAFADQSRRNDVLNYIARGLNLLRNAESDPVTAADIKKAYKFRVVQTSKHEHLAKAMHRLDLPDAPMPILSLPMDNMSLLRGKGVLSNSPALAIAPEDFPNTPVPEFGSPADSVGWNPLSFLRKPAGNPIVKRHYFSIGGLVILEDGFEAEWIEHAAEQLTRWNFSSSDQNDRTLLDLIRCFTVQILLHKTQFNGRGYDWNSVENGPLFAAAAQINKTQEMRTATSGVRLLQRHLSDKDVMCLIRTARSLSDLALFVQMEVEDMDIKSAFTNIKAKLYSGIAT